MTNRGRKSSKKQALPINKSERVISTQFALLIKEKRKQKGLTLKELGEKLDVNPSYLHRLEKYEKRNPSIAIVMELAEVLDIDLHDLFAVADRKKDNAVPIEMLLLKNEYSIKGKRNLPIEVNEIMAKIISVIVNEMDVSCKYNDLLKLGDMIKLLHEIINIAQPGKAQP
ncbi:helix-turn-helix domain-containing protein [Jeotgalibacillus sp. JSM ZJ347]|uniref:helix-turn-helix domain-containing protein n=1 Tax=Jeotgalibacillus sp. JSM ZJ347 TaxID=3342117 RepID=UPI0035A8D54D